MYLLGVLVAVIGVGLSIALHEIGHLVPAKAFGVKVTQYMVGFGPTVWSRRRGETQYGIKAIPLGGYVRMIGMLPPRPGDRPGELRPSSTGRWSAMVDDARAQSMEEIDPADEHRVFYRLPFWQKVIVMAGGPLMNLVIATALLAGIMTIHGVDEPQGVRIASVVQCVRPATSTGAAGTCTADDAPAPAMQAGLRPGDRYVAIDGRTISTQADVAAAIRPKAGQSVRLVVERDGARREVTVTPIANQLPVIGENGRSVKRADGSLETTTVGYIGTSNQTTYALVKQPLSAVPGAVGTGVWQTAKVILDLPARLTGVAKAAFGSGERDADSPMSVVGVGRVAGEVTSGQVAGVGGGTTLAILLQLIAGLNIALFVFNLVPLMPLDGGHIAGALWEGIKRGIAKVTGRPDPGYVDVAKGLPIAYAMSVVLIGMSVLLMYADIVRPVKIGG